MKNSLLILLLIGIAFSTFGQSFSYLKEFKTNGHILYEPSITEIIDTTEEDNGNYIEVYVLMKTKINKNTDKYYIITFDYGPSEDPSYNIYLEEASGNNTHIAFIGAEQLIIPGNGNIYCSSRTNQLYDKKRKFKLSGKSLIEVKQAAYYIGLKSKTNTLLTLYADINKTKKVAVLPKGYDVEVLIEKDGWLMIKTPFGLTGWVNERDLITYDVTGEKLSIKGLYYMGD